MTYFSHKIITVKRRPEILLAVVGLVFVFIYSWLYLGTPEVFNSPDETANFVFIEHFINYGDLRIITGENPFNIIHPRSVNVIGDSLVPGFFTGLILFLGYIGKITGTWLVLAVPSLISVLGVLAYYGLIKRVFGTSIAFVSALMLFFLPQWWHYSARGFLPNIIFLSLAMIAGLAFIKAHEYAVKSAGLHMLSWAVLAGVSAALSIAVRPSEIWWLLFIVALLFIRYRKKLKIAVIVASLIPAIIIFTIAGYWQIATFGGLLATGYDRLGVAGITADSGLPAKLASTFFPFGVEAVKSLERFWNFNFALFWWQIIPVAAGFMVVLRNGKNKLVSTYLLIWGVVSLYLILYYGSWLIADDLDAARISIGVSYIRYWLFIYLGWLPFLVFGVKYVSSLFSKRHAERLCIIFLSLFMASGAVFVYGYGDDNLSRIRQNVVEYNNIRQEIIGRTDENAVIISERSDKIFWPYRQVIHFADQDFAFADRLGEVAELYDVYWFTYLPDSHVKIWEQKVFAPLGLQFGDPVEVGNYKLYKISIASSES